MHTTEAFRENSDLLNLRALVQNQDLLIQRLESKLGCFSEEIERLHECLRLLRQKGFAPSSEKRSPDQLELFQNDTRGEPSPLQEEGTVVKGHTRSKRAHRGKLPESLPREEVIVDLDEKDKVCPHDGTPLTRIGEEISEALKFVPAEVRVIVTVRPKYACKCCQSHVATAPVVPSILPRSIATPSLLAYIVVAKYCDALPLFRISKIFKRSDINLPRQTMAKWMIAAYSQCLPILNIMNDDVVASSYMGIDETTFQVLKEEGKKATTKSYFWVRYRLDGVPIIVFTYSSNRASSTAEELLEGFSGYLQCDGYSGYDGPCDNNPEIIRVGCLDHCRRYFFEAWKAGQKKGSSVPALNILGIIYNNEDKILGKSPEEKLQYRNEHSRSAYESLHAYCLELKSKVPAKSLIAKAITYTLNEWPHLIRPLEDGRLRVSNILVENKIRPLAIGRKNFLFANSVDGAKASAGLYSLAATAEANGKNVPQYFERLFSLLPFAKTLEDFEKLLPYDPPEVY
jgi:transposase